MHRTRQLVKLKRFQIHTFLTKKQDLWTPHFANLRRLAPGPIPPPESQLGLSDWAYHGLKDLQLV